MPSEAYTAWVCRLWDRLRERTGHPVYYVARNRVAAYCPSCRVGTLSVTFVDGDPPHAVVSASGVVGTCTEGCTAAEVMEALS